MSGYRYAKNIIAAKKKTTFFHLVSGKLVRTHDFVRCVLLYPQLRFLWSTSLSDPELFYLRLVSFFFSTFDVSSATTGRTWLGMEHIITMQIAFDFNY